ncbi:prepilin-type N-terminal cleavage/methylation domain-containing protein [Synechococcus sp. MIT S9452]|uniref:prepilin-type N-terminal cleavage/methylation domain-containing protein n=1 Tax=Synechococcus sp. MIT S9452 TaxID=3082546 RepID=UPI0039A76DC2
MLKQQPGFSLLELLLACSVGLVLLAVALQALLAEQRLAGRLGVLLQQRQLLLRANQLITADVERGIALAPELTPRCNLAGRQLLMQILSPDGGLTTYTVGAAPSTIWQGQVLMRCGPAYGLDGQVRSGGAYQNRVVLDGLAQDFGAWSGCQLPTAQSNAQLPVCWEPASGLVQWQLLLQRDGVSAQRDGQALLKSG